MEGEPSAASANAAPGERGAVASAPTKVEQASGLWQRIKEHKILQWGLGYLGAALALAHGQELLADTYEWPHSIGRILMTVLILGLPVVLTLAWYHGHKDLKRIGAGEVTIIALLLVICAAVFFVLVRTPTGAHRGTVQPRTAEGAAAQPAPNSGASASPQVSQTRSAASAAPAQAGVSLAVLPFVNMSDDKEQDYFSDGLSEELLNQLAQIKDLRVAGRTSSFAFKGKNEDLRVIAQALGVNHLLEGSVRKAGDQLRITAQLINAADGSHLWSHSYDRELKDVFKVQEDIAKDVADALSITLGVGDAVRAEGGTSNVDAYDKYLRAKALANLQGPDDLTKAAALFREAVALDPNFALGWLGLYKALLDSLVYLPQNADEIRKEMSAASDRVNALSPDAWWTHAMRAHQFVASHRWADADREVEAVLKIAPSEPEALFLYTAFCEDAGRFKESSAAWQRVRQSDPLSVVVSLATQHRLDIGGRAEEAQIEYERSRNLAGDQEIGDVFAVPRVLALQGRAAARAQMQRFLVDQSVPMPVLSDVVADFDNPPAARAKLKTALDDPANQDETRQLKIAFWASFFDDVDLANAAIHRFAVDFSGGRLRSLWHPVFAPVRKTQGFKDVVRELGLVDYWRSSGDWGDFCHPLGATDFECR